MSKTVKEVLSELSAKSGRKKKTGRKSGGDRKHGRHLIHCARYKAAKYLEV